MEIFVAGITAVYPKTWENCPDASHDLIKATMVISALRPASKKHCMLIGRGAKGEAKMEINLYLAPKCQFDLLRADNIKTATLLIQRVRGEII